MNRTRITRVTSAPRRPAPAAAAPLPLAAAIFLALPAAAGAQTATDGSTVLPTVRVQGTAEQQPNDGYVARTTRVGKTLQDPHDIPQAVTTVTRQLMDDQNAASLKEALRNVAGLTFNAAEGGRAGDNMMLRGFYTFGDMYLDGIRDTAQYNRELFALEQVDVLRGAGAMLFGRGQAGGVINQVTKAPTLFGGNKVTATVGTNDYRQATADLNQRIGETTAIRINAMTRDEGSWRRGTEANTASRINKDVQPEIHRDGIQAAIRTGIGTDHEFTLSHLHVVNKDRPDYGVPFWRTTARPVGDAGRFYGDKRDFDSGQTTVTTATHQWRIDSVSELRTQVRRADYDRTYWATAPTANSSTGVPSASTGYKTRDFNTDNLAVQSDFSTKFSLAGMKHDLLVGGELLKEDSIRYALAAATTATGSNPVELAYFGYGNRVGKNPVAYTGDTIAAYVQDTVEFIPGWKFMAGARHDHMKADYRFTTGQTLQSNGTFTAGSTRESALNFSQWSWRSGLSWQPDEYQHYYLTWSDSFSPTADLYQTTTTPAPPERSQVIELGSKWNLLEGDLTLRTAVYQARKQWERNTDLESEAGILTRKRHTNGFEVEAAGRITTNWEAFLGLAFMDAKIDKVGLQANGSAANAGYDGMRPRNAPPYAANLWTTYKLAGGWRIGGGVELKGARLAYSPNSGTYSRPNVAEAYQRWDAMVSYEQPKYAVKVNFRNLLDKTYYDAIYDNGGFVVPGVRRSVLVTTELKF